MITFLRLVSSAAFATAVLSAAFLSACFISPTYAEQPLSGYDCYGACGDECNDDDPCTPPPVTIICTSYDCGSVGCFCVGPAGD